MYTHTFHSTVDTSSTAWYYAMSCDSRDVEDGKQIVHNKSKSSTSQARIGQTRKDRRKSHKIPPNEWEKAGNRPSGRPMQCLRLQRWWWRGWWRGWWWCISGKCLTEKTAPDKSTLSRIRATRPFLGGGKQRCVRGKLKVSWLKTSEAYLRYYC